MYKILFLFFFFSSFSFLYASNTIDGDEIKNSQNTRGTQNPSVPEKTDPVIDSHFYNSSGGSTESSAKRKREDDGIQDQEPKPKRTKVEESADVEEISTADLKKTSQENESGFLILPDEVLVEILYFSDLKTFWALREVCKRLYGVSGDPKLFIPQEPKLVIRWIQGFINQETLEVDQERLFQDLFYRNRHTRYQKSSESFMSLVSFGYHHNVDKKDIIFPYDPQTRTKTEFTPEFKALYEEYLKLRAFENKSFEDQVKQRKAESELRRRLAIFLPYEIAYILGRDCFEADVFTIEDSMLKRLNAHPLSALPPFLISSYLTDPTKDHDELLFRIDRRLGLLSHEISAQEADKGGTGEPALYLHRMLGVMEEAMKTDPLPLNHQQPEDLEKFEKTHFFNYRRFINIAEAMIKILNREFYESTGHYRAFVKSLIAERLKRIQRIFECFIKDIQLLIESSKESLRGNAEANGRNDIDPEKEFHHHKKVGEYERRIGEMYLRCADFSKVKIYYNRASVFFTRALTSLTKATRVKNLEEEQERLPLPETVFSVFKSLTLWNVSVRWNSFLKSLLCDFYGFIDPDYAQPRMGDLSNLFREFHFWRYYDADARTSTSIREMTFSILDLLKNEITEEDLYVNYKLLLNETDRLGADEEKIKALWSTFFKKYVLQFPVSKENAQDFLQLLSRTITDDMCDEGLIVSENFPRLQIVEECYKAVFHRKLTEVLGDDLSAEDWVNLANISLTYAEFLEKEEKKDQGKIASLREEYVNFLEHVYEIKRDFCGHCSFENFLMAFVQAAQSYLKVGDLDKASAYFSKAVEYSERDAYGLLLDLGEHVKDYLQAVDVIKGSQTPQAIAPLDQQVLEAFVTLAEKSAEPSARRKNICRVAEALMQYKADLDSAKKWEEKRLREDHNLDEASAADLVALKTIVKSFVRNPLD